MIFVTYQYIPRGLADLAVGRETFDTFGDMEVWLKRMEARHGRIKLTAKYTSGTLQLLRGDVGRLLPPES